jgi:hypothetical protein
MANGDDNDTSFLQDLLDSLGNNLATLPVQAAIGIREAGRGARDAINNLFTSFDKEGAARNEQAANEELQAALGRQQVRQEGAQREAEQLQARADFDEQLRQQVESGDFNFVVRDDEIIPQERPLTREQSTPGFSRAAPGTSDIAARRFEAAAGGGPTSRARAFVDAGFTPEEAKNLAAAIPPENAQEFLAVAESRRRQTEGLDLNNAIKAFLSSNNESLQGLGAVLTLNSLSPEDAQTLGPDAQEIIKKLLESDE